MMIEKFIESFVLFATMDYWNSLNFKVFDDAIIFDFNLKVPLLDFKGNMEYLVAVVVSN
jgi:hypothetical protein